ncbi:unnamed protein product [Prorocentrum cordatum]|uniref:EF-hand domain-containing protein n=1 Tax=Prorocentrum cordatum TaxID=2364126 RepID=A0ABN9VPG8_9DINO|nr:unnamed protein product [Polarella glacialis]
MLEEDGEPGRGDGREVDVKEIRASLQMLRVGQPGDRGDVAQRVLDLAGADVDGKISTEKWQAAWRRHLEESEDDWDEVSQAIAALDIDIFQFQDVIRYAFTNFDENGDGKISLEEFCLACKTLGVELSAEEYARIFIVLSRGGDYIKPEGADQQAWQSFGQGFDAALKAQYVNKGFARAQFVVNEVGAQWDRDVLLPLPERVARALATFWNQAESFSDLVEFLLDLVGVGIALGSINEELNCLPDCKEGVDVANLIPLVFLLRKSLSDVFKEVSDNSVQDLDRDTAVAFATVFKPAGVKLTAFTRLRGQGARWHRVDRGQAVPYLSWANGSSLQLIVRGSMSLSAQGNVAGLSETVAVLKAGSFIGGAQFIGAEDGLVAGRSSSSLLANEDVLLLEWPDAAKLRSFLDVNDDLRTQFTSVIVRSMAASMSQVTKQSKKFATELPMAFRSFNSGLATTFNADRATVWIHSPANNSLWTWFVAGTGKTTYVSIPAPSGLVGVAFAKKSELNIPDCYEDDRFNSEVDKKTGYLTKNMLCVPVFDEPSEPERVIGVVQLINKMSGRPSSTTGHCSFTEADTRRMFEIRWTLQFMMKQLGIRAGA